MRTCEIENCDKRHQAKGLCRLHYQRMKQKELEVSRLPECYLKGCTGRARVLNMCSHHFHLLKVGVR
jgi:hypothetical protein